MHFPHRKMAKIPMNKHRGKGSREEVTYPGSPRSQKWVGNLLPVLEGYNYNHTEIIQLVKACDYNGEKIQQEVDRIMEINIGHEQGEWTVVKPQKVKNSPTAKGSKGSGNNFRREGNKVGYVPEVKTQRRPKNVKDASPSVLVNQAVGIVTSSATVASTVVTPVETAVEMENFKNKREKKPTRDNQKDSSSKDGWKEVQKHPQQNSKKPFPMQWAALLKTKPEDTTIELPPGVTSPEAPPQPKQSKKPVEPKPVQQETKAVKPEGEHGVDAIALAKAEETLKKLEVSERIMMETQNQQKLIPTPKEQATDISPQRSQIVISPKIQQTDISPKNQQIRQSFGDVDDSPPVIMPKPLSGDIDASVMFVFFDEEPVKDTGCAPSSPTASYQQSSLNRRDKYPRGSHVHDGNPTMPRHCSSGQQHEQIDQIPGYNAQMHQENAPDVSFPGHWPMGYYGSRYSNTKHQPFSYAYEDDKHKNYRQTANEHYVPKDSRHHLNGVYVNYGYQHDRLQTPPGLVGFYTPQQPFYGFPNSSGQANPHGPSDSMTSSMWRT